ncbi:MAG: NAD(P)H-binding protein [Rhodospirillaceae bacterium]|nr:NAD(P)H-binding protein [Rhodospirillaceae bacterium]
MIKRRAIIATVASLAFFGHCGNVTVVKPAHAQEGAAKPAPVLPSMAGETVLVAGATGRVGKVAVELLKAQGVKVKGFSRNIDKAKEEVKDVQWVKADVRDPKTLKNITKGVDRIIFAVGSNSFKDNTNTPDLVDNKGVAVLVDEARKTGVKQFVLISSVGVTRPNVAEGTDFQKVMAKVLSNKLEGENYLRASGLNYTVIRPVGLWNRDGGQNPIGIMQGDVEVPGMITRADVAAVAVNALVNPDAKGKTVTIFNVTHPQLDGWKSAFAGIPADAKN